MASSFPASANVVGFEEHPPEVVPSAPIAREILGMAFFIGSECALFGSFFFAYFFIRVVGRANYSDWIAQMGHYIPLGAATTNTLILFSSSVTIHYASLAMRRKAVNWRSFWVAATFVLGAIFLANQIREYSDIFFNSHIGPAHSAYSSVFFILTGLHATHVTVGLLLLAVLFIRSVRGHYGPAADKHIGWEAMSIYWHFVDGVWVFVFGLIYLPGNIYRFNVAEIVIGIVVLFLLFLIPSKIWSAPKHLTS